MGSLLLRLIVPYGVREVAHFGALRTSPSPTYFWAAIAGNENSGNIPRSGGRVNLGGMPICGHSERAGCSFMGTARPRIAQIWAASRLVTTIANCRAGIPPALWVPSSRFPGGPRHRLPRRDFAAACAGEPSGTRSVRCALSRQHPWVSAGIRFLETGKTEMV